MFTITKKKQGMLCLLLALFCHALAGCGSSSSTTTTAAPPVQTEEQLKEANAHYTAPSDADRK